MGLIVIFAYNACAFMVCKRPIPQPPKTKPEIAKRMNDQPAHFAYKAAMLNCLEYAYVIEHRFRTTP